MLSKIIAFLAAIFGASKVSIPIDKPEESDLPHPTGPHADCPKCLPPGVGLPAADARPGSPASVIVPGLPVVSGASQETWLDYCLPLTKHFESCYLIAYCDPGSPLAKALQKAGLWYKYLANRTVAKQDRFAGLSGAPWTAGWGTTGPNITESTVLSQPQADAYLTARLTAAADAVLRLTGVPLRPNELAALADFTYNVGATNYSKSLTLKSLNAHKPALAMDQLLTWNLSNGEVLEGLNARRAAEKSLFLTGEVKLP